MADVPFGGFLAKVDKGTRLLMEQVRVDGEVWLPKRIEGRISARVLIMRFGQIFDYTYRDYRRAQAESSIVRPARIENRFILKCQRRYNSTTPGELASARVFDEDAVGGSVSRLSLTLSSISIPPERSLARARRPTIEYSLNIQ